MHFQLDHDPSTIGVSTTHDLGKMDLLVTRCRMLLSISCEGPWKLDHDMISPFPCPDICRRPASQRGHMMYCVSFLMTHGLDAIFCMLRSASCKHPKEGQSYTNSIIVEPSLTKCILRSCFVPVQRELKKHEYDVNSSSLAELLLSLEELC
ncbi:uncharacterized protein LOC123444213 isoform X3 [Hordeum vulgare subsp. vulgare]|uniref:uncharacterized protein LOC123444213 isoform X3 n=1 Tax=Hordeum vulgare subsp. vulgare TaxID=112509 RepID=UPI001D1A412F|nr:uncharacterized protein LOC123444213 isoform X3 [Hordeum vulgare subsp. vulgare]